MSAISREYTPPSQGCFAVLKTADETRHACWREPGHDGPHRCFREGCRLEWETEK